jgi:hypothetical protein
MIRRFSIIRIAKVVVADRTATTMFIKEIASDRLDAFELMAIRILMVEEVLLERMYLNRFSIEFDSPGFGTVRLQCKGNQRVALRATTSNLMELDTPSFRANKNTARMVLTTSRPVDNPPTTQCRSSGISINNRMRFMRASWDPI